MCSRLFGKSKTYVIQDKFNNVPKPPTQNGTTRKPRAPQPGPQETPPVPPPPPVDQITRAPPPPVPQTTEDPPSPGPERAATPPPEPDAISTDTQIDSTEESVKVNQESQEGLERRPGLIPLPTNIDEHGSGDVEKHPKTQE
ncbi:hypothetical protein TcasGA2_TC014320 [Tribolium castaneum]|uniref:Uncharacterized protein n=2 Tax=Tribolium castaneum TaxID=7070 RepID=D6WLA4_TRICA|nr:hypothetical protein TcasGA2_TC014320 [Tribolium castaneum]